MSSCPTKQDLLASENAKLKKLADEYIEENKKLRDEVFKLQKELKTESRLTNLCVGVIVFLIMLLYRMYLFPEDFFQMCISL